MSDKFCGANDPILQKYVQQVDAWMRQQESQQEGKGKKSIEKLLSGPGIPFVREIGEESGADLRRAIQREFGAEDRQKQVVFARFDDHGKIITIGKTNTYKPDFLYRAEENKDKTDNTVQRVIIWHNEEWEKGDTEEERKKASTKAALRCEVIIGYILQYYHGHVPQRSNW
jgi:hypothetical protein